MKLRVNILNSFSDCRILTFCCRSNDVIFAAWNVSECAKIDRSHRCNDDEFMTVCDAVNTRMYIRIFIYLFKMKNRTQVNTQKENNKN